MNDSDKVRILSNEINSLQSENAKLKEALEKWKEDCASNVKYSLELKEALENRQKVFDRKTTYANSNQLDGKILEPGDWLEYKTDNAYWTFGLNTGELNWNQITALALAFFKEVEQYKQALQKAEREMDEFAVNICSWLYELDEDGDHNYESYKMISESVRYDLMVKDFKQSQLKDNGTKKEG